MDLQRHSNIHVQVSSKWQLMLPTKNLIRFCATFGCPTLWIGGQAQEQQGQRQIKSNGTFECKDNNNEKTTNEKANPSCCMYFLNSWELMYVEDGKVVVYITHFLGNIFSSNLKNNCLFSFVHLFFFFLIFFISTNLEKKVRDCKFCNYLHGSLAQTL